MRNLLFLFLICTGVSFLQAQEQSPVSKITNEKVQTALMPMQPDVLIQGKKSATETRPTYAVFVFKHSRVKRALSFRTKADKPKLV